MDQREITEIINRVNLDPIKVEKLKKQGPGLDEKTDMFSQAAFALFLPFAMVGAMFGLTNMVIGRD